MIRHQLRHGSLTRNVIEDDIEGYIGKGTPRMKYTKRITTNVDMDSGQGVKGNKLQKECMANCAEPIKRLMTR